MSAAEDKTPEEIEADIEQTRTDLGENVAELADRADVKKQAKNKVKELQDQAQERLEDAKTKATEKVAQVGEKTDRFGGSGGDIGSGPTGDVRNSPEIVEDGSTMSIGAIAGAFVAGLVVGWVFWH